MKLSSRASVVLALFALAGCAKPEHVAKEHIPDITVIKPIKRAAIRSITLPGDVVGYYEAALHSKVTGYLESISVDKGDWVRKGQQLAQIEVPELRQNLDHAKAELEINRLTYQRLKHVRDTDPRLVAREDVDIAYSKMAEAQATVSMLETLVGYTHIIAPFDGVVTGRFADPGALIRAGGGNLGISGTGTFVSPSATEGAGGHLTGGGPLLSLARIDKLRIYVYVPEQEAALVRVDTPVEITLRALPNKVFHAQVTRFATSLDLATRTMLTEIDVDNPKHELYPRMYASVRLELVRHPDAIELPTHAVEGFAEHGGFVYEVKDGILIKRPVSLGISDGRFIEITAGLSGGEAVVSSISPALNEGEKVRPIRIVAETPATDRAQIASDR